jgi:hypothetical protein
MTNTACIYPDRDAVLVSYLYDDIEPADRVAFETHVATCFVCRSELADLRGVRSTLGQWSAPDTARRHQSPVASPQSVRTRAWWRDVPVWAQAAAAMLVLGVSAAVANLDVRYGRDGLNVRTGWSTPEPASAPAPAPGVDALRAELTAFETELRAEVRAQGAKLNETPVSASSEAPARSDAEFHRLVRAALDEREKKQEQDLALHLVQLQRDFNAQRQADIRRTNQLFRDVMSTYGDEIAKQQRQINYLLPNGQK